MDAYMRLISIGIRPDCAMETVIWYQKKDDEEGLERYISNLEHRREESNR